MRYTPALMVWSRWARGPRLFAKASQAFIGVVSDQPVLPRLGHGTQQDRRARASALVNARMGERSASVSTSPFSTQTAPRARSPRCECRRPYERSASIT